MHANDLALGRNHFTADSASMTSFGDCFRTDLRWADGAHVQELFDTRDEALANLRRLGWNA